MEIEALIMPNKANLFEVKFISIAMDYDLFKSFQ